MITDAIVILLFAIVGIALIAWIAFLIPELGMFLKEHNSIYGILKTIFNAAPVQQDAGNAREPVKTVVRDVIPILFWLLILLPMFVFPLILIIFPLFHIPWSYLLPPTG